MNVKDPTIGINLRPARKFVTKVTTMLRGVPIIKRFLESRWAYYAGRNLQLVTAVLKLVTFALIIDIWHSHKWIVNSVVSDNFIITRDMYLNDCAYTKKGGHLTYCSNGNKRLHYEGFEFGRIHGHGLDSLEDPPLSLKMASAIFEPLIIMSAVDVIGGFAMIFMKDMIVPKAGINGNRKPGYDTCTKLFTLFTTNTFFICLLYTCMGWIIDSNKRSGLAVPTDFGHDTIGPTVIAFIIASGLFVIGVVTTALSLVLFTYENIVHPEEESKAKNIRSA
uniref:Ion_trans domain-containing protein n=1 Tax=Panagrellus redivivus TaxID=6233 RepID=A0A7E4V1V8_PANRE